MPRTKFSPELTERLVELVRAGNYVETAAKAAGIHKATYYSWMTRGEKAAEALSKGDAIDDEEAAFADFFNQVSQAEAVVEAEAVAAVRAADKGWQAHMTYLERRLANRWRQQSGIRYATRGDDRAPSLEDIVDRVHEGHEEALSRLEREGKIRR